MTNDWTPVISALAVAIPVITTQIVIYIKLRQDNERNRKRQYLMIDQNTAIIKEQQDVKEVLNGNNKLIPKIDNNVQDVHDILIEEHKK